MVNFDIANRKASIEKLPSLDWPVGMSGVCVWQG